MSALLLTRRSLNSFLKGLNVDLSVFAVMWVFLMLRRPVKVSGSGVLR